MGLDLVGKEFGKELGKQIQRKIFAGSQTLGAHKRK
jgi:hypothetical protein